MDTLLRADSTYDYIAHLIYKMNIIKDNYIIFWL